MTDVEPRAASAGQLLDSDDDFVYQEVDVMSEEDVGDDASEDLDAALHKMLLSQSKASRDDRPPSSQPTVEKQPEVVDDFIRNFLVRAGLNNTLEQFETEWYDLKAQGKLQEAALERVPDAYAHNAVLSEDVHALQAQLQEAEAAAAKAAASWDGFRKERDHHRMHHKRVVQEKNRLIGDLKRLREHYAKYEPTIKELRRKNEVLLKEKTLVGLERDRLRNQVRELEGAAGSAGGSEGVEPGSRSGKTVAERGAAAGVKDDENGSHSPQGSPKPNGPGHKFGPPSPTAAGKKKAATLPVEPRRNPFVDLEFDAVTCAGMTAIKTFKGHGLGVANVAMHPRKPVVVTASDDKTWRMWHVPDGDLIMSGEGHKDWVSGIDFHPRGVCLASASGDATVKVWDFARACCVATLTDHTAAVWGVAFHDAGEFLASCSLDHSIRLWDLTTASCRSALRGHVDSINEVAWLPFSNTVASASSDKTVSLWDARTGIAAATFYGHPNSVNSVTAALDGRVVASCDADGNLKVWDVRMVAEAATVAIAQHPLNRVRFDRSGGVVAAACEDGHVYSYGVKEAEVVADLVGHEDAVQAIAFDPEGKFLVSASSDCTFKLWQ